jgi:fused signal recognition particle receptor
MIADQTSVIFLVLIAVAVVFGGGVVVLSRRRSSRGPDRESGDGSSATSLTLNTDESESPADSPATSLTLNVAAASPEAPTLDDVRDVATTSPTPPVDEVPTIGGRIGRSRSIFSVAFAKIRGRDTITQDTWDDLEETLLRADVGVKVADTLLSGLRESVKARTVTTPSELMDALRSSMKAQLSVSSRDLRLDSAVKPNVWLFVGVNGVGKTTTIGKVGAAKAADGVSVLMAAGDTFRAAAAEQLETWAGRAGAAFVRGGEGADPASVIYDGIQSAESRGSDLVLADTAGRLQNKTNLMDELRKVRRVADKAAGEVTEVLLVIDATTGQNGLSQAREFADATQVTGVVLTKLDGSAKGGIVFAIETELGIPVKLVGVGETQADLIAFDGDAFVDALFD